MWEAWITHHHHGRGQHWSMMRRSSGRRQKLVSTEIPFYGRMEQRPGWCLFGIRPVSTRPSRIAMEFWPWWNHKKWKWWYLLRTLYLETRCKAAQASEHRKRGHIWHNYVTKPFLQHLVTAWNFYQIRPDEDDGWWQFAPSCRAYTSSRACLKTNALAAIPAGTIIYWTSHWSPCDENSWRISIRSCDSINMQTKETRLTLWYQERLSALWTKSTITRQRSDPVRNCSTIFKNRKEVSLTMKER